MTIDDAIRRYLADLTIGKSPKTVQAYGSALRRFRDQVAPEQIEELHVDHLIDFVRLLSEDGVSKATVTTYGAAVITFYTWLNVEDIRPDLPLAKLHARFRRIRGRTPHPLPRVPTDKAVETMLQVVRAPAERAHVYQGQDLSRLRNIALIETLRGSGLRIAEAAGLRRRDLEPDTQTARVLGKGSKERIVYFTTAAWRALEAYFAARQDADDGEGIASFPVFGRHDRAGQGAHLPLGTRGIWEAVKTLAADAGLDKAGITPHRFRAWCATKALEKTGDLAAVQDLLGHADPGTTRLYANVSPKRLREVHRRTFGDDKENAV